MRKVCEVRLCVVKSETVCCEMSETVCCAK